MHEIVKRARKKKKKKKTGKEQRVSNLYRAKFSGEKEALSQKGRDMNLHVSTSNISAALKSLTNTASVTQFSFRIIVYVSDDIH